MNKNRKRIIEYLKNDVEYEELISWLKDRPLYLNDETYQMTISNIDELNKLIK